MQPAQRSTAAAVTRFVAGVVAVVASVAGTVADAAADTDARLRDELVVGGLNSPTAFQFFDDGILIAEKSGIVRLSKRGRLLPSPFVDLRSEVNADGDRGLLSIAVGP